MDRFILNYNGNKYQETKKYLQPFIEQSNFEYIAEPFGGIFGFSRFYYFNHFLKNDKKKDNENVKFLINDIDKDLINFYKDLKKDFEKTLNNIRVEFDNITKDIKEDKELTHKLRQDKEKHKIICLMAASVSSCYSISQFNTKFNNFMKKKDDYIDFFKKAQFYNMESNAFIEKHKNKKNILFYFDPPYFNSCNKSYDDVFIEENGYYDGTSTYIQILKQFETSKASNMLVLNKIDVINYLFKNYIYKEYKGTYNNTFKKGKNQKHHIIYTSNIDY